MPTNPFASTGTVPSRSARLRRSCLAVPGSNARMLEKAADTDADQIFLDLEDAVAPNEKVAARSAVVNALSTVDYGTKVVTVRVNDATTRWQYQDIIDVITGAGEHLDCLMIPKVQDAGQLWFVENLMSQLEQDVGLSTRIGIEVQIETGTGSVNMTDIASVTDRIETLIFGPGDYAANQGIPQLDLGMIEPNYPGHQWHHIIAQIVNNARAVGCDAIDGPYGDYSDADGYRESATRARLLGVDGKWCIHPSQVSIANEVFSPSEDEVAHAKRLLEAYSEAVNSGKGAASLDGKMIDEASRKMAEKIVARGEATAV